MHSESRQARTLPSIRPMPLQGLQRWRDLAPFARQIAPVLHSQRYGPVEGVVPGVVPGETLGVGVNVAPGVKNV